MREKIYCLPKFLIRALWGKPRSQKARLVACRGAVLLGGGVELVGALAVVLEAPGCLAVHRNVREEGVPLLLRTNFFVLIFQDLSVYPWIEPLN